MKNLTTILMCLLLAGCCTKSIKPTTIKLKLKTSASDPLPCDPCGTNTYEWPPYTSPVYTNGELFCKVISSGIISVSNTSPYKEYVLQFTTDLIPESWSVVTPMQIGHGENFYSITNLGYYRAQDVTGDDLIVYPTFSGGSGNSGTSCPGSYAGYWVYRPTTNIFPLQPVGNSQVVIDPTGSIDTRAQVLGRFGDSHCGALPLTLATLPDPYYSLTVYFKTLMVGTNYPIILKGFQVRTD